MDYYGRDGQPITQEVAMALLTDPEARRVARTKIDEDTEVSTVHLVLDHGFGFGPPLIFETMIFGGPHDQDQWRYATEAEAVTGHEHVVGALRAETVEAEVREPVAGEDDVNRP